MLCQFQVQSKVIQLCIYMLFSRLFSLEHSSFPVSLEAIVITTAIITGWVFPWWKIAMYQRNSTKSWFRSKKSICHTGDVGSIPGSGRSWRVGNGNPLQYYCLENPMDRGSWWTTVAKSWTQLGSHTCTSKKATDSGKCWSISLLLFHPPHQCYQLKALLLCFSSYNS